MENYLDVNFLIGAAKYIEAYKAFVNTVYKDVDIEEDHSVRIYIEEGHSIKMLVKFDEEINSMSFKFEEE